MTNDKVQAVQQNVTKGATWVGAWLVLGWQMVKAIVVGAWEGMWAGAGRINKINKAFKEGMKPDTFNDVGFNTDADGTVRCPQCAKIGHQDRTRCCFFCGHQFIRDLAGLRVDADGKLVNQVKEVA